MSRGKKPAGDEARPAIAAPLRPRKKLLIFLVAVFAAWVVFLVVLYFTTVWRQ